VVPPKSTVRVLQYALNQLYGYVKCPRCGAQPDLTMQPCVADLHDRVVLHWKNPERYMVVLLPEYLHLPEVEYITLAYDRIVAAAGDHCEDPGAQLVSSV
jgi:hypothetical protein